MRKEKPLFPMKHQGSMLTKIVGVSYLIFLLLLLPIAATGVLGTILWGVWKLSSLWI